MGQTKSKTWRRLSESDCSHLLFDDTVASNRSEDTDHLRPQADNRRWSVSHSLPNTDQSPTLIKFSQTPPQAEPKYKPYVLNNLNRGGAGPKISQNGPQHLVILRNSFGPARPGDQRPPPPSPTKLVVPKLGTRMNPRPISMYPLDSKLTPKLQVRLSLTDLLERINTFEDTDQAQFSDQTLTPNDEEKKVFDEEMESPKCEKSIRCSGLYCLCDRCLALRFKLLNWLLPNCTRTNAERLLNGRLDGTFLVRKSEKFPGQYTLSFVCQRTVRHCLIMRSVYGFGLRWPYSFETLQQVILHYTKHSLTEFNSKLDVILKYPVFMAS